MTKAKAADVKPPPQDTEAAAIWVATDSLHEWKDNPRKNDKAVPELVKSIKRFGFGAPILARKNGEIIGGHTRWKAAKKIGLERVPVRFLDLDPAEAHLLALADNKIGEIADWDETMLAAVINDLRAGDVALTGGTGFDEQAIEKILTGLDADVPAVDESDKLGEKFQVVVDCEDERQQAMLIDKLQGEGFEVRALLG